MARDFSLRISVKYLFCTLVRPILQYGAFVWDPHTTDNSLHIERVQRRFFRFSCHLLNISCNLHDYALVFIVLNLLSLAERRCSMSIFFLKGLLENKVDSFVLFSLFNFKVPFRTAKITISFLIPHSTTNYLRNEPIIGD